MQGAVVRHGCGGAARDAALLSIIIRPDTSDRETTVSAGSLFYAVFQNVMPGPPHQQFPALRAIGIRTVAVNVALIDVVQSGIERDLPRTIERRGWSPRFVLQLEVRVKGCEV